MAPRHYDSAIAKAPRQHALFASPFAKLKSRTLDLLDTITGGTIDAETEAENHRLEEQRRNATCRGCDITFDGLDSLSAHHSLFPDHATRRRAPARSQSAPMLAAALEADAEPPPPVPRRNRSTVTAPGVLIDFDHHDDDASPEQSGLLSPPRPDTMYSNGSGGSGSGSGALRPRRSFGSIAPVHRKPVPTSEYAEERNSSSHDSSRRSSATPGHEDHVHRSSSHAKSPTTSSSNSFPTWRPFDATASSDSSLAASPNPGASPSRRASPSPMHSPSLATSPFAEPTYPAEASWIPHANAHASARKAPPPPPPSATYRSYSRPAPPLPPALRPRRKSTNPFLPDDAMQQQAQASPSADHAPRSPSGAFAPYVQQYD